MSTDKNGYDKIKYLELLSYRYPNKESVISKIISSKAILNMPKATEHFVSDIHGQYDSFSHVVKNASGVIKNYIEELFKDSLSEYEKRRLATICYYPEEKLMQIESTETDIDEFYRTTILQMIEMTRRVGSKYTHSKVMAAYPPHMGKIIDELLYESPFNRHKEAYYNELINEIIRLKVAKEYIAALAKLTQRFAVEYLHVIGDIYDRGDKSYEVMDFLSRHHSVDIQWGNHDIAWIGATAGSEALILNVLRIAARYDNLSTLEDDYGINLMPLASFAATVYAKDDCLRFIPKTKNNNQNEISLIAKMHKALSIMQFKAEGQIIKRRPEYNMDGRLLLDKISEDFKSIKIGDKIYPMNDTCFPTLDISNPYEYSREEAELIEKLVENFRHSPKLNEHIRFMINKGSMYLVFNDNLLFHGCIPMNESGEFRSTEFLGIPLSGKSLMDKLDYIVRMSLFSDSNKKSKLWSRDILWYLWCGQDSPLFGKDKMTTFERYFIDDKKTHNEEKDPYFNFRDDENILNKILDEFSIDRKIGRVINGHVPVKVKKGESPVKAGGKMLAIDGGFSEAYQAVTGIAGYTLISNSYGLLLAAHEPFVDVYTAIENDVDVTTSTEFVEKYKSRRRVYKTDLGKQILEKIKDLKDLLECYNNGKIAEKEPKKKS